MKLQPLTLPADKAKKELKQFAVLAIVFSAIGLVIWFLGIIGLAFGARALVLAYNQHNKPLADTAKFRALAILAVIIGLVDVGYGLSS